MSSCSVELAVEAMRRGARDFVQKPWENQRLLSIIRTQVDLYRTMRKAERLEAENNLLRAQNRPVYEIERADVTISEMLQYLKDRFVEAGPDQPVFILRVFEQQRTRRAMIVLFLAVLEAVRMQAVAVAQKDLFGEIALVRHTGFDSVFASDQPMAAIEKDYI